MTDGLSIADLDASDVDDLAGIDGTEVDVVTGKARSGQHSVDHVISYEIRRGDLVEVSQRNVAAANMR